MKAIIIFLLLLVVTRPSELHKQFRLRRDDFGPAKSLKNVPISLAAAGRQLAAMPRTARSMRAEKGIVSTSMRGCSRPDASWLPFES
jgi:hypothetical protein